MSSIVTPAKLIAEQNTTGVVEFARQNGHDIPNDPRYAYEYLCQAFESDPKRVMKAMSWLHPHAQYIETPKKKGKFNNFDFSQYDPNETDDSFHNEALEMLERGWNYGRQSASSAMNQMGVSAPNMSANGLASGATQLMRDHSKEILTYGAVLLAGIFIGKFLMK